MDPRDTDNDKTTADGAADNAAEGNAPLPDATIEGCAGGAITIEQGPDGLPIFGETNG